MLEALDQNLLEVQLLSSDWPILCQSELSEELAQSLQVLLNLAHSA